MHIYLFEKCSIRSNTQIRGHLKRYAAQMNAFRVWAWRVLHLRKRLEQIQIILAFTKFFLESNLSLSVLHNLMKFVCPIMISQFILLGREKYCTELSAAEWQIYDVGILNSLPTYLSLCFENICCSQVENMYVTCKWNRQYLLNSIQSLPTPDSSITQCVWFVRLWYAVINGMNYEWWPRNSQSAINNILRTIYQFSNHSHSQPYY